MSSRKLPQVPVALPPIASNNDVVPGLESWRRALSRVLGVAPTPPIPVSITATPASGGILVKWLATTRDTDGYLLELADNASFNNSEFRLIDTGQQQQYFDSYPISTMRYYRLYALNGTDANRHSVRGKSSYVVSATSSAPSSGAPTDASYVLISSNASLTGRRILAAGTGIAVTDGGATGNVSLAQVADTVVQRVAGRLNSGAEVGTRRRTNYIAGTNISLALADDNVNNELALTITNAGAQTLTRQTAFTDIANTVIETTWMSVAVPANALSTNKVVRLRIMGKIKNDTGGNQNITLRVKYGATTMYADVTTFGTAVSLYRALNVEVLLAAAGATNAQVMSGRVLLGAVAAPTTGVGTLGTTATLDAPIEGTAAIDSTVSQNLVVTWQWGGADVNMVVHGDYGYAVLE